MAATERQFSGAVVRADLAWLDERAQVRERVPPERPAGRVDRFVPDADGRGATYELGWD